MLNKSKLAGLLVVVKIEIGWIWSFKCKAIGSHRPVLTENVETKLKCQMFMKPVNPIPPGGGGKGKWICETNWNTPPPKGANRVKVDIPTNRQWTALTNQTENFNSISISKFLTFSLLNSLLTLHHRPSTVY